MKEKPTEKQLFDALISQTAYGIWVSLGKLQNPVSGETSIDLTQASIQIDMLDMINNKMHASLTDEEREDRAMFAYEACVISKERLFPTDVFRRFGWNEDEAREFSNKAGFATEFQRLLFSRVVPNLSRIGLLTDKVRPLYDELGVLEFESHSSDGDISWADLEKPLDLSA